MVVVSYQSRSNYYDNLISVIRRIFIEKIFRIFVLIPKQ